METVNSVFLLFSLSPHNFFLSSPVVLENRGASGDTGKKVANTVVTYTYTYFSESSFF